MNKTIWKYGLELVDRQTVKMPQGGEVLTVQTQGAEPCLWALVNPEHEKEERIFEIHGTGNPIHADMGIEREYIGTFQQPPFVWHVFERVN